jgi:hypothetical protein
VVYDGAGLYSAARVWWTFRLFGAEKAYILDGGLPQWKAEGRPIECGEVMRPARKLKAEMNTGERRRRAARAHDREDAGGRRALRRAISWSLGVNPLRRAAGLAHALEAAPALDRRQKNQRLGGLSRVTSRSRRPRRG